VTQHVLSRAAYEGRRLPDAFGLDLEALGAATPADIILVVTEQTSSVSGAASSTSTPTSADGSLEGTIQATGEDAMKVLLQPNRPGVPGVRVVIGAVS
jgi:hypothetical protein